MGNALQQRNRNREFQSVVPFTPADGDGAAPKNSQADRSNDSSKKRKTSGTGHSAPSNTNARSSGAHLILTEEHLSSKNLDTREGARVSSAAAASSSSSSRLQQQQQQDDSTVEPFTPGGADFTLTESQQRRTRMADCEFECSEIYPYLYVSGHHIAGNREILQSHAITHVINCSAAVVENYFEGDKELNLQYMSLSMVDGRQDDISWFVCDVIQFILKAMTSGGKVLVHCEKGISRSCSFVIAYRMWSSGESWKDASDFVKKRRKVCSPNTTFTCNLIEIGELINKNSAVSKITDDHHCDDSRSRSGSSDLQEFTSGRARRGGGGDMGEFPLLLRCAYHLPHDHKTPLLKICRIPETRKLAVPATSMLDPRGVFILRAIGSSGINSVSTAAPAPELMKRNSKKMAAENPYGEDREHYLYLWQGKLASTETAIKASNIAGTLFGVLSRTDKVTWIKQGKETAEFMNHLVQDGECRAFAQSTATATSTTGSIDSSQATVGAAGSSTNSATGKQLIYSDYYDYPPNEEECEASRRAIESDHTALMVPNSRTSSLTKSGFSSLRGASFVKQLSNGGGGQLLKTPSGARISRDSSLNKSNNSLLMCMTSDDIRVKKPLDTDRGEDEEKAGADERRHSDFVPTTTTPSFALAPAPTKGSAPKVPTLQGSLGESLALLAAKRDAEYPINTSRRGSGSSNSRRGSGSDGQSAALLSLTSSRTTSVQLPRTVDEEYLAEDDANSKDTRVIAYSGQAGVHHNKNHIGTVNEGNKESDDYSSAGCSAVFDSEQNSPRTPRKSESSGDSERHSVINKPVAEEPVDHISIRVPKNAQRGRAGAQTQLNAAAQFNQPKITTASATDQALAEGDTSRNNSTVGEYYISPSTSVNDFASAAGVPTFDSADLSGPSTFSMSGPSATAASPELIAKQTSIPTDADEVQKSDKEDGVILVAASEEQKGSPLKAAAIQCRVAEAVESTMKNAPNCDRDHEDRDFLRKSSFKLFGSISTSRPSSRDIPGIRFINTNKVAPLQMPDSSEHSPPQEAALTTGAHSASKTGLFSSGANANSSRPPSTTEFALNLVRARSRQGGDTSRSGTPVGVKSSRAVEVIVSPRPALPHGSSTSRTGTPVVSPRPGLPLGNGGNHSSRTGTPVAGGGSNHNSQSRLEQLPLRLLARTPSVDRHPADIGLSRGPTPIDDLTPDRLSANRNSIHVTSPPTTARSGTPVAMCSSRKGDTTSAANTTADVAAGDVTDAHIAVASDNITRPILFQAVASADGSGSFEWQSMGVYDDEDLTETALLLLLCPGEPHFLWVGAEFDFKDVSCTPDSLIQWARSINKGECSFDIRNCIIEVAREGEESENFWAQFNEGF